MEARSKKFLRYCIAITCLLVGLAIFIDSISLMARRASYDGAKNYSHGYQIGYEEGHTNGEKETIVKMLLLSPNNFSLPPLLPLLDNEFQNMSPGFIPELEIEEQQI